MIPAYADDRLTIYGGDMRDVLAALPAASVHAVVTSPPYWSLRDYGIAPSVWGGDQGHEHRWGDAVQGPRQTAYRADGGRQKIDPADWSTAKPRRSIVPAHGQWCECGAWLGALGLEPDPESYIAHLVESFRAIRRVLRPDGVAWLNLGDSFAARAHGRSQTVGSSDGRLRRGARPTPRRTAVGGLKAKDLIGVPWSVAFALRADGWYLRSEVIWSKNDPMPESVSDRPTKSHEHVFMITRSGRYFYDADAVRARRALRTVWTIPTEQYRGDHSAAFPQRLVEPCIKAATSERGVCPECGAPWRRETQRSRTFESGSGRAGHLPIGKNGSPVQGGGATLDVRRGPVLHVTTIGWHRSCPHEAEPVPAIILDPFAGTGTVGVVAQRFGRRAILVDASPDYVRQAIIRASVDPAARDAARDPGEFPAGSLWETG